jgi:hypothetical protein
MSEDLDLTDEQLDSLIDGTDNLNQTMPETEPAPAQEAEAPAQTDGFAPFTFTANGKEVTVDNAEKLKQWASMGYNYGQHINQFKQQQDEFNSRQQGFDEKYALYEKIDKAAAENPDWWNHVQNSFNQVGQQGGQTQPQGGQEVSPEVQAIKEELGSKLEETSKALGELMAERNAARMEQEDKALKQEIQSIRENYQDLDWTTPNEEGKTLEYQVLEHAQNKGINSFDAAFKTLMHDQLMDRAKRLAEDNVRKEVQRNHKIGLLGETPEPLKKYLEPAAKPGDMSWEALEQEAAQELGIAN